MPFINANRCDFFYQEEGSGLAIVFLHGQSHSTDLFPNQFSAFSNRYRCLAYDRRGHARSQVTPYGYSLTNQVYDLKCILDALRVEKIVLIAVAMSTTIGVSFALRYPTRIVGLVLSSWYEIAGYPDLEERRKNRKSSFADSHLDWLDIMQRKGRSALRQHIEDNYREILAIFPTNKPAIASKLAEIFSCHQPAHYIYTGEFYTSIPNLIDSVKDIRCPILGICGEQDPSPDQPDLLAGLPNFRQKWIADARRFTMLEQPQEFNALVAEFLAECHYR